MKAWQNSIIGGAIGAAAVVALLWLTSLPQVLGWIKLNDGVAAWAAIILNGVGLWFIFRQLGLTQIAAESAQAGASAAKAATEIALAESRPWLKVEIRDTATVETFGDPVRLGVRLEIEAENIGRTPATHVRFHWDLLGDADDSKLLGFIANLPETALQGSVIFPGESRIFGGGRFIPSSDGVLPPIQAMIVVTYSSPGGGRHVSPALLVQKTGSIGLGDPGPSPVELHAEIRSILQPT